MTGTQGDARRARADWLTILAATLSVVAIIFAVGAFLYASSASDDAQSAKNAVSRSQGSAPSASVSVPAATSASAAGATPTLHVSEKEFSISTDAPTIPAGKVSIEVTNTGKVKHELVVLKTDNPANALPLDKSGDAVENGSGDQNVGELDNVKAGATESKTFTLTAGQYALICNIPGHYHEGMTAPLTVT